jgi:hypothetical protein
VINGLRLSPWFWTMALRYLVPAWFLAFAVVHVDDIVPEGRLGFDARLYHRAAAAWMNGMDPWATGITLPDRTYHFAGLPPTVLAVVPTTVIPEDLFGTISVLLSAAAAAWIIRKLKLGWSWLLFPPLVQGVLLGQPGIWVLALLVTGNPVAEALAAALKIYGLVPMVARLRFKGIVVFAVASLVSIALFADLWVLWWRQSMVVASRLVGEVSGGVGATAFWWLIPPTVAAVGVVAFLDRRAAGWLAVPALWPSAQYHYPAMALPAIRILPALVFSVPVPGAAPIAVMLHACLMVSERFRPDKGGSRPGLPTMSR